MPMQTARDLFMQLMYLVRCKEEMDIGSEEMARAADALWREQGLDDTNTLFGLQPEDFAGVSDVGCPHHEHYGLTCLLLVQLVLLSDRELSRMRACLLMHGERACVWLVHCLAKRGEVDGCSVMEFNQMLFRRRWPIRWGLQEALAYLRTQRLKGPPYDKDYRFHDSFYLVTHIAFAVSAYFAIKTNPRDIPWLFNYNRRACLYWVKLAGRRQAGRPADLLVDIVTVQSLRDRNFEYDRKGNAQWAQFMNRLLPRSNLRTLETKIVYEKLPKLRGSSKPLALAAVPELRGGTLNATDAPEGPLEAELSDDSVDQTGAESECEQD
ncbi:unnamed protein product [Polarella glacialis]|uniref:Uncharacterized protein n=1 Tax=Polarella glacialis TaxID=89957 RepID=A0A813I4R4_POLGL|nr:unnamed protein product [Polarella glacialis]